MHLLYVDESGDTGLEGSQTRTFTLSGLMVHHAEWHETQATITRMRRRIHEKYGYPPEAELRLEESHARHRRVPRCVRTNGGNLRGVVRTSGESVRPAHRRDGEEKRE